MFKIAVACEKNLIVKHYSKCLNFDIYTIKDNKIINKENFPAISLKQEEISKTFQENNIKYIICDGIGDLARKIFCDNKIEVIMEASGNCRQAVLNFLNKKLTVSSLCSDLSKKRKLDNHMSEMKYIYGPIPSRRLGQSLGISPIPKKYCNYSCIYCQLGRTTNMTNKREMFYKVEDIIAELDRVLKNKVQFDVVSIVGSGEPTLYKGLGKLIEQIKLICNKPVVVITNGALLNDKVLQEELLNCDIILPTIDAYDEESFKIINRPHKKIIFNNIINGIIGFSKKFKGEIWLEIMFMENINDDERSLNEYKNLLKKIKYDKLYLNTPIRPPAEQEVNAVSHNRMQEIASFLQGVPINIPHSIGFHSEIKDNYKAIVNIIQRHPMNQYEIVSFLKSRKDVLIDAIFERLNSDNNIEVIDYKGYQTYRLKTKNE